MDTLTTFDDGTCEGAAYESGDGDEAGTVHYEGGLVSRGRTDGDVRCAAVSLQTCAGMRRSVNLCWERRGRYIYLYVDPLPVDRTRTQKQVPPMKTLSKELTG